MNKGKIIQKFNKQNSYAESFHMTRVNPHLTKVNPPPDVVIVYTALRAVDLFTYL